MAEMSKYVIPPHMGEENPSKKILKLAQKITDVFGHKVKITANDPEYWGLREIVTDEMADIALKMKLREHYTFEELIKLCKIEDKDQKHFQELLDEMSYIGLLEYDYGNFYTHDGPIPNMTPIRRYTLPLFVPGSAEILNMEEDPVTGENNRLKEHPALASFFERMTYIPLAGLTHMVPPGGAGIGMHVIPVEKAIPMESKSVDIEHISHWLKKYEGHLGVGQCSCRVTRGALNEGCADDSQAWCIGVGDFADYSRETGKGHDITYEQAMAILKKAEDNGFVHQITNIDGDEKIFGICNCNVNICNALRTSQLFNTPNLSASAYRAHVDTKNCVACGKCVEYCPAGAVKLGQKLCTKNGQIQYPKHELPNPIKWGPDKWNENYRDDNRINCYETGTAPCKTACPAHIAIQGYLKMAGQGRYQEALALIKKDNPFPAICGRVCNRRCEDACTRGTIDEAVAIDNVKKFIADLDLNAETRYIPEVNIPASPGRTVPLTEWPDKIAIVGAGPAGLSAAYYLALIGYKPTVFEKNEKPGGMMRYGIPSYKLEKDVIDAEIEVLKAIGVDIKCGIEVGKDVTIPQLKEQGYKAFYFAIGCQGGRLPGIPGEDANNIHLAVDFLHEATENQEQFMEGNVVVIGGGNVAVDCARTAKRFNAASVSMFALESRNTMPASNEEIAETLEEEIAINNGWGPKEIIKDENGNIKSIIFKKCLRTIDPETKRFSPFYDETQTMEVEADHIVFAIGQAVEWGGLLEGTNVTFSRGNYPKADTITYQTDDPCVFVGGDVLTGPKFVIDAIAAGHYVADVIHRYVRPNASLTIGLKKHDFIELNKDDIVVESYDNSARQEISLDEAIDRRKSFRDAHKNLTEAQVKVETSRCLGCGASIVDENQCIGCGICTTKCEFDAIHLFRDVPEASTMIKAEDKFKAILPYAAKSGAKLIIKKK